ncbi:MAG: tRNA (guanosine(37)-N1)-methyltransferase TrmD [bacterium]
MEFDVLTLFPEMFEGPLTCSIVQRAREKGLVTIRIHDIRDWAPDRHHVTDDSPYGGGGGMVMKCEPLAAAISAVREKSDNLAPVIYLSPQGEVFTHDLALDLLKEDRLILLCGHYEGMDERLRQNYVDREVSLGDFVLTGGELPAMVMIDALVRLLPGGVGNEASVQNDSFSTGLLDYPHYTRPEVFENCQVPEVLLSGNHKEIERWRRRQALERTYRRRPDLLERASLTPEDRAFVEALKRA